MFRWVQDYKPQAGRFIPPRSAQQYFLTVRFMLKLQGVMGLVISSATENGSITSFSASGESYFLKEAPTELLVKVSVQSTMYGTLRNPQFTQSCRQCTIFKT